MQPHDQFVELLQHQRELCRAVKLLGSQDDVQRWQLGTALPEHLAQYTFHVVPLNREAGNALADDQAQASSPVLVVLIVQGEELSGNTLPEIKNG